MSVESYKARFLSKPLSRGITFSKAVNISPELIYKIKLVTGSMDNPVMTVRSFVNNLIEEHFKEFRSDCIAILNEHLNRGIHPIDK